VNKELIRSTRWFTYPQTVTYPSINVLTNYKVLTMFTRINVCLNWIGWDRIG